MGYGVPYGVKAIRSSMGTLRVTHMGTSMGYGVPYGDVYRDMGSPMGSRP